MLILHGVCGVWIKNVYWQAHMKTCSTDVLNEVVVESRKIPPVLSLIFFPCVAVA